MARLPAPGSDDGTWGHILNDFLQTAHNADGTIKNVGVIAAKAADTAVVHVTGDETISGVKTFTESPVIPAPSLGTQAATKSYVDSIASSGAPDADAATRGLVRLAGDLGGTADAPTVPGLSGKASTSHAHAGVYMPVKNGTSTLSDSTNDMFARVNIANDTSPTSGWSDRLAFYYDGVRTGYHNEYGELRARPAKTNTVAFRAMEFNSSSTANILEVAASGLGGQYFTVSRTAANLSVPLSSTQNISTTGTVTGSNIGPKVLVLDAGDPVPNGTPVGTIIIRRS